MLSPATPNITQKLGNVWGNLEENPSQKVARYNITWLGVTLLPWVDHILSIGVAVAGASSPSSETQSIARVQKVEEREAVASSITSSASTLRGNRVEQGCDDVGIIPGGIASSNVVEKIDPHQVNVVQTWRKATLLLNSPYSHIFETHIHFHPLLLFDSSPHWGSSNSSHNTCSNRRSSSSNKGRKSSSSSNSPSSTISKQVSPKN